MKGIKLIFLILVVMLLILGCQQSSTTTITNTDTTTVTTTTTSTVTLTLTVGNKLYDLAPDFQLQDLEGNTVSLSDFRGSPVLVTFWRST